MATMTAEGARERFAAARVARLATADADGRPHVVPVVFAVDGDAVLMAVDHKPKRSRALKRLADIAANPAVCLLADGYQEDWDALWWARADGTARVRPADERGDDPAIAALVAKYPAQYGDRPPPGPVIEVTVTRWSGWTAAG
ncbi:TIGR03668 family PPOX class F420-dependent oxidoreductase [Streptomyces sp. PTM05]|uniref:TIGR03668 family PPOX class F420-dependent oxidoreductase n=1 Tax=Streptantibioticus parmotrematis TaxID=2873249 RepID=A0ABS7QJR5_9ACTN|nr:TIGR03668 family PPOX class F420-dependent oxidoreductase [Streptantibioticus parmotrematis]MBY8883419.1 TIGR03668 family PPOX class F420-dependent oxidoreductase [Streptantibioticus parmotrematis]